MRSVFLFVVLVNVLVMAAYYWSDKEGAGVPPLANNVGAPSGELLVLLEEVDRGLREEKGAVTRLSVDFSQEVGSPAGGAGEGFSERAALHERKDVCEFVGPFPKLLRAEYFIEHLSALDVLGEVEVLAVPGEPSFWVYQNPEASRKAALRKLHELQAEGVDSYVIPKGDLENGISFGLFNQRKGAEDRLKNVTSMGYEAKIRRVERTFEEIWVILPAAEAAKIGQELWLELLNREYGLERRQNICSGVAS